MNVQNPLNPAASAPVGNANAPAQGITPQQGYSPVSAPHSAPSYPPPGYAPQQMQPHMVQMAHGPHQHARAKSQGVAYLLWAVGLFGILGFHWFYLGLPGRGLFSLLTLGLFGILAFLDLFMIPSAVRRVSSGNL